MKNDPILFITGPQLFIPKGVNFVNIFQQKNTTALKIMMLKWKSVFLSCRNLTLMPKGSLLCTGSFYQYKHILRIDGLKYCFPANTMSCSIWCNMPARLGQYFYKDQE